MSWELNESPSRWDAVPEPLFDRVTKDRKNLHFNNKK